MARRRKWEQFLTALTCRVEVPVQGGWDDLQLRPQPLPGLDLDEVCTGTVFLGHPLRYPVMIAALTGGHPSLEVVNLRLGRLAARFGLAVSVGSQRAQLAEPGLARTYQAARRGAPGTLVVSNIGAPQLVDQADRPALHLDELRMLCDSLRAGALAIHLNFVQEALQPHGNPRGRGCLEAIARVAKDLGRPVVVKETGAGLTQEAARSLQQARVAALETSGAGGASMAVLEGLGARHRRDPRAHVATAFYGWGVPAPASLIEVREAVSIPVIAGGGIRNGVDAVRALAAGAQLVSVGLPLLRLAARGQEELDAWMGAFLEQLKIAMFLVGAGSLEELANARPLAITGWTREYLQAVGVQVRPGR
ncbi:MAG: type 2 isopentenyl-diphosphate Delta-isomerase [Bacillota bacterium]